MLGIIGGLVGVITLVGGVGIAGGIARSISEAVTLDVIAMAIRGRGAAAIATRRISVRTTEPSSASMDGVPVASISYIPIAASVGGTVGRFYAPVFEVCRLP